MENLEKSWNFKMFISRPGEVMEKSQIMKVLEKSWKCCYMRMFIYAEFEIIDMFFERKTLKNGQHFLNCACLYRDFSLVVEPCSEQRRRVTALQLIVTHRRSVTTQETSFGIAAPVCVCVCETTNKITQRLKNCCFCFTHI